MSDGTLNLPERSTPPSAPTIDRHKIWVSAVDGKPKITNDDGSTTGFASTYGSDFSSIKKTTIQSNNNTGFDEYLSLDYATTNLVATNEYEIHCSFIWNYNDSGTDFRGRILVNGNEVIDEFRQEPKDPNTDQRHYTNMTFPITGAELITASGTISFEFAPSINNETARMHFCYLKFKRLV